MKQKEGTHKKKQKYHTPSLEVLQLALEHSIAASSTTVSPGGGESDNYNPWIREEEAETVKEDWYF